MLWVQMVETAALLASAAGTISSRREYPSNLSPGSRDDITRWRGYGRRCGFVSFHSFAMIDLTKFRNYYIDCGYTDLRLGIDRLASVVM